MAKKQKKQDYKSMSAEELRTQISDAQLQLKRLTFGHAVTPIENPMAIRLQRREIARMQTALRRQQLGF